MIEETVASIRKETGCANRLCIRQKISSRKDKKINQMSLKEVQNKIEFLKARNEYNPNNKYADALTDRFLELLKQDHERPTT